MNVAALFVPFLLLEFAVVGVVNISGKSAANLLRANVILWLDMLSLFDFDNLSISMLLWLVLAELLIFPTCSVLFILRVVLSIISSTTSYVPIDETVLRR